MISRISFNLGKLCSELNLSEDEDDDFTQNIEKVNVDVNVDVKDLRVGRVYSHN